VAFFGLGDTHFNWRPDVANLVSFIENSFPTFGNTYFEHPTGFFDEFGFPFDDRSVDFWAPFIGLDGISGRGIPIDFDVGQAILDFVFFDPNPPFIRWYIWQGVLWTPFDGEVDYCAIDPDDCHFNHVHFTFF
jgi:hypothetical protein